MTTLKHVFQTQATYYYCGPAATRVALSCRPGILPSQVDLAIELGTTTEGTDSAADVAMLLNGRWATDENPMPYGTHYIGGSAASHADTDQLRRALVDGLAAGFPLVANGAGDLQPVGSAIPYRYPGGHYVAVTGYDPDQDRPFVSDVAVRQYWTTLQNLADWIASRAYAYPKIVATKGSLMSYRVRSGAADQSIYLVPGGLAPSGRIACFAIYGSEYDGFPLVQLPDGASVDKDGKYDVAPTPFGAGGDLADHNHHGGETGGVVR